MNIKILVPIGLLYFIREMMLFTLITLVLSVFLKKLKLIKLNLIKINLIKIK